MSFWSQTMEVARIDLRVERRLGDTFRVILPFAVMALLVFPLALGTRLALVRSIGLAVFWALSILFGTQVSLRHTASDSPARRDLYGLLGVDPAAKFVGRCLSGSLLMVGFLTVLYLAMVLLYNPELPGGNHLPGYLAAGLFAVGTTALATLAGELTTGLRNRTALAALIVAPLSVPLVVGASQTWASIDLGAVILSWMLLLAASTLALLVVGVSLARALEESAR
jgi:heme exporter protein B